jgi:hypothetical protein
MFRVLTPLSRTAVATGRGQAQAQGWRVAMKRVSDYHSLTPSLIHSLYMQSCTISLHSLTHSCTHTLTQSPTASYSLTHSLTLFIPCTAVVLLRGALCRAAQQQQEDRLLAVRHVGIGGGYGHHRRHHAPHQVGPVHDGLEDSGQW